MASARILIVDDDPILVNLVGLALRSAGYATCAAYDGQAALTCLREQQPDLVLLDVMMPGCDGWEVCRRMREVTDVPIIMLTAKRELGHRLRGLDLGADDYIVKPFDMEELILRVAAVLRRAAQAPAVKPLHYDDGCLCVDEATGQVTKRGRPLLLTATELALLVILAKRAGEIVPTEELTAALWPNDHTTHSGQPLRVFVNALRRKLEDDPRHPRYVINRRGVGYGFQGRHADGPPVNA